MAATMEPIVGAYPDSPLDPDDTPYPCKGCGEILEEGKAFELAGNRWHIDCFRCNTCNTLLDSDANLLLLGDGSLICNNCTYSCSSCGNKIEDLAILTGDQAFCANCFKCRNCKRKIENLRYARTSQGIFCMDCHEALMARRRKKTGRSAVSRTKLANSVLDKSLPAIPPPEARATHYIPENETAYSHNYNASVTEGPSISQTISELRDPESAPVSAREPEQQRDVLTLPSTTFRNNRASYMSHKSDMSGGEEFLIPVAFDPTPPVQSPTMPTHATPRVVEERPRDYFSRTATSPSLTGNQSNKASPHIAYQEKSRQMSKEGVQRKESSRSGSATASPYIPSERSRLGQDESSHISQMARTDVPPDDKFKLQDAPKAKRVPSQTTQDSQPDVATSNIVEEPVQQSSLSPDLYDENAYTTPRLSQESSPASMNDSPRPPQHPAVLANLPKRGDSLESAKRNPAQTIPRKQLNADATIPSSLSDALTSSNTNARTPIELAKANGGKVISAPIESPQSKSIFDTPSIPLQPGDPSKGISESFVDPRAPPAPPSAHSRNESVSTMQSRLHSIGEPQKSPSLPRYSAGGDFTMDEDMARIMNADGQNQQESFLRRVSNSVRHGRSYSDKAGRMSRDRWPRSPGMNALGQEISSPTTASPETKEEIAWFKNELRRERQKLVDREKRIAELEAQLDSKDDIKQVNSELKEKRSTMVVLDTQKEIVVRELEVLTEHIAAAKANKEPFDISKMTSVVLRDFASALEKLKNSFAPQIEDSIQKRNELMDEITNLTQVKDKSFMEFEQLSSKNAQLAELNNQLVHQIQELYKANSGAVPDGSKSGINGLGIYAHKDKSIVSIDAREMRNMSADLGTIDSGTTLAAGEAEPVTVLQGPHVVNIRKGGQPKKFDWRKGQKVAKGVTKGLKGAFSSAQQNYSRDMHFAETGAYGQQSAGPEPSSARGAQDPKQGAGFGFFGGQQNLGKKPNGLYAQQVNASTPSLVLDAATHLYGADIEARAEYEKTSVPTIVARCIEEVEERGMDVEGIYRKSGGNSQVQQVRDAFEHDPNTADISDPDLDIHAVTSALKQYFRKLPVPLITYDVYDQLLDTTIITDKDQKMEAMRQAIQQLPQVNYDTLEYLMKHLARVVVDEKINLMTSMNIAVVFAPTIMRPESVARELSETKGKNECVMAMVEGVERLFRS